MGAAFTTNLDFREVRLALFLCFAVVAALSFPWTMVHAMLLNFV